MSCPLQRKSQSLSAQEALKSNKHPALRNFDIYIPRHQIIHNGIVQSTPNIAATRIQTCSLRSLPFGQFWDRIGAWLPTRGDSDSPVSWNYALNWKFEDENPSKYRLCQGCNRKVCVGPSSLCLDLGCSGTTSNRRQIAAKLLTTIEFPHETSATLALSCGHILRLTVSTLFTWIIVKIKTMHPA